MVDNFLTLIFSLTPFGLIALMTTVNGNSKIEYGALALCAAVVFFLCNHIKHLTKKLEKLVKDNTAAYNRLANMLGDRPCLMQDSRIEEE